MGALATLVSTGYQAVARRDLAVSLVGYLALAVVFGYRLADSINPDGVSYARLAGYLAEGNFALGIVSYWSPLLPWCMAPLVALGIDPLHAARIVLAIAGAVQVVAVALLLRWRSSLPAGWRLPVLALVAVGAVGWTTALIRPDALLAACLLCCAVAATSSRVMDSPRVALAAGLWGGLAALAKAYGLPFVVVFLPLTLCLGAWPRRHEAGIGKRLARAVLTALLGVLLFVGPWIGIVSAKYGRLTWSSVAAIAHAVKGPGAAPRYHPVFEPRQPPPGRLTVWEVPETLDYDFWSPFAGKRQFEHQMGIMGSNAIAVLGAFREFDALGLCVAALFVLPLLSWRRQEAGQILWVWATLAIFAGGFLPIFFRSFYLVPFLWPLCAAYLVVFLHRATRGARFRPAAGICLFVTILSLSWMPMSQLGRSTAREATLEYRAFARRLAEQGAAGAVAAGSERLYSTGMYVAYHLDLPYLHVVEESSVSALEELLARYDVRTYLLDSKAALADELRKQKGWRLIASGHRGRLRILGFSPPQPEPAN